MACGLERLLATCETGKYIKDGIDVAIVGKPNVGKSSLFNRLIGSDRVIVSGIPGALRDIDALLGSLRVVQVKDLGSRRVRVITELPTGRLPAIVAHYRRLKAEATKDVPKGQPEGR